jgi:hypothetical protein
MNDTLPYRCRHQKRLTMGERENTHTKQHQAKARATKTQQDLPVNTTINNRLLACMAIGVSSISI